MMEDENHGVHHLDLDWSHSNFSKKCPNIDLTLTSCLAEIENKFQYGALAKTVTVTVTP